MTSKYITDLIRHLIRLADAKYGEPASAHESLGVLQEEFTELIEAIHRNSADEVLRESMDLAAAAIRLAENCLNGSHSFFRRSGFLNFKK
jgi:NTP pyrophosphatase (non-canonical NTP hydrolase)